MRDTVEHEQAQAIALSAMREASLYGNTIRFLVQLFNTYDVEQVFIRFFDIMRQLDLQSALQLSTTEVCYSLDSDLNPCGVVESNIFEIANRQERIVTFSNRLLVASEHTLFIIKNMPAEDAIAAGQLTDMLAVISESLEAKMMDIMRFEMMLKTSEDITHACDVLAEINTQQENYLADSMNNIISGIQGSFDHLNLTEEQEVFFTQLAEKALASNSAHFEQIYREQEKLTLSRMALDRMLSIYKK